MSHARATLAIICTFAARVARPVMLALVAAVPLLWFLFLDSPPESIAGAVPLQQEFLAGSELERDTARASWLSSAGLILIVCLLIGAGSGRRMLGRDAHWIYRSGLPRVVIDCAALGGLTVGAIALCALSCALHWTLFEHGSPAGEQTSAGVRLQLRGTAGPDGSLLLSPSEALTQHIGDLDIRIGARLRIRVVPTFGGDEPTTVLRLSENGAPETALSHNVVRRSWIEIPLGENAREVTLENTGRGAVAVLGPRAIEIWDRTDNVAAGALRMGGRVALLAVLTLALAFALGAWMGAGIAGMLTFALVASEQALVSALVSRQVIALPGLGALDGAGPLAQLSSALRTVAEGRVPSPLPTAHLAFTAAALLISAVVFSVGVRRTSANQTLAAGHSA